MKPHGFPSSNRLLARKDFLRLYAEGRRAYGRWAVVYAMPSPAAGASAASDCPGESAPAVPLPWRVGITATRKLGGAVKRNRVRRLVREFMRLRAACWPAGVDFAVNLRPAADGVASAELWADLEKCFKKLGCQADEAPLSGATAPSCPPSPVSSLPGSALEPVRSAGRGEGRE